MARTRQLAGVLDVKIDGLDDRLVVRYDPSLTDEAKLTAAVIQVIDSVDR